MNFFIKARIVLSLLPIIIQAVKAIEEAIPFSGKGKEKLEVVRNVLEKAFEASNDIVGSFEDVWPTIEAAVVGVVNLFNIVGIFKKNG